MELVFWKAPSHIPIVHFEVIVKNKQQRTKPLKLLSPLSTFFFFFSVWLCGDTWSEGEGLHLSLLSRTLLVSAHFPKTLVSNANVHHSRLQGLLKQRYLGSINRADVNQPRIWVCNKFPSDADDASLRTSYLPFGLANLFFCLFKKIFINLFGCAGS